MTECCTSPVNGKHEKLFQCLFAMLVPSKTPTR